MAQHNDLGKLGEQMAARFLEQQGYQIIATNWRFSRAEIDIIAFKDQILTFVEVKTRSHHYFGQPEEFVTAHKEVLLNDAAAAYMEQSKYDGEVRFDIISVILKNDGDCTIEHFEDAFFPEW